MPSVYSAMRGSRITTSSIDLKALVWREIAAAALAVQPEFLARASGADGGKTLAVARIGDAHHLGNHAGRFVGIVTGDIAQQHHLGQTAVALLALGRVAHGLEVAWSSRCSKASQQHARALLLGEHIVP